jgi:hypothetical protein
MLFAGLDPGTAPRQAREPAPLRLAGIAGASSTAADPSARDALSAVPNPAPGGCVLRVSAVPAGVDAVVLGVYDVRGRRVRTLIARTGSGGGFAEVRWDGTDGTGAPCPGGIYFVRKSGGGGAEAGNDPACRILVLR